MATEKAPDMRTQPNGCYTDGCGRCYCGCLPVSPKDTPDNSSLYGLEGRSLSELERASLALYSVEEEVALLSFLRLF